MEEEPELEEEEVGVKVVGVDLEVKARRQVTRV